MTILGHNQSFRVDGYDLSGVSDVSFSTNYGKSFTPVLGRPNFGFTQTSPPESVVSFSRSLIYADPIFNHTGDSSFSGSFAYNGNVYGFSSGYLTSYSVSASVGQVPSVSASVQIFGELTSGFATQAQENHPSLFVPSPRSISVTSDFGSSDKVTSFNYSISPNRLPQYSINGGLFPDFVGLVDPVRIEGSLTVNLSSQTPKDAMAYLREVFAPQFVIIIKDRMLQNTLMTLPVSNAEIVSSDLSATTDSPLNLNISYQGYL